MSKNDQNFDRLKIKFARFKGWPGGLRGPPGGIIGGSYIRQICLKIDLWRILRAFSFPISFSICRNLTCNSKIIQSLQKLLQTSSAIAFRHRTLSQSDTPRAPPLVFRAADWLPQGGTPPPARPFTTAPRVKSFLFLSISAICNLDMRNCDFFSNLLG